MSCANIEPRVALYAGGDLDEPSARDVERHMATCADCRDLLTVLRGQHDAMGEWRTADFSQDALDDVRQGVLAAIAHGDARPGFFDRIRVAPFRAMAWSSAGVAAAALLVFAVWTTSRPPDVQPVRDAAGATPAPITRAASHAEGSPATRPRPAATTMATAGKSLASALPAVVADASTAAVVPIAPSGPVRRIEFQTADPNIRIIWLMPDAAPDPAKSAASGR